MPVYKSGEDIETFFKRLETYFALSPMCDDIYKINMLQMALDEFAHDIATNINIPDEHAADYDYYKKAYVERFEPPTSTCERRRSFRQLSQGQLSIDEYYDVVRKAASQAFKGEDSAEVDRLIAEQMAYGLVDPYIKRRLLESETDSTKEVIKAVKLMTSVQSLTQDTAVLSTTPKTSTASPTGKENTVAASTSYEPRQGRRRERSAGRGWGGRGPNSRPSRTPDGKPICYNCGKANHIAAHCRSRSRSQRDREHRYLRSEKDHQ